MDSTWKNVLQLDETGHSESLRTLSTIGNHHQSPTVVYITDNVPFLQDKLYKILVTSWISLVLDEVSEALKAAKTSACKLSWVIILLCSHCSKQYISK